VALSVSGSVDVDPGPGVQMVTGSGATAAAALVMLGPDGDYRWHRLYSGSLGMLVTVATSGDLVTMGNFTGTIDFDPQGTHAMVTSTGQSDLYVTRIAGDGTYRWTRTIHSQSQGSGTVGIVAGPADTAFVYDYTTLASVDLDPGGGVDIFMPPTPSDNFIVQFSAAGNHLWSAVQPPIRVTASGPQAALVVGAAEMSPIGISGLLTKYAP
jgi:hypothetical protein